jgi:anti-sigma factor RsiW
MRCPVESQEDASLLLDYCARKLDPDAAALLERHMKACPACREFQGGQQAVWNALDEWEAVPVSAGFNRRLYSRIDSEASAPWWSRLLATMQSRRWKPALPLAAACLVLVAVALFDTPSPPPAAPGSPVRVEMVQVDQMERALEDLEMLRQFDLTAASASNSGSL